MEYGLRFWAEFISPPEIVGRGLELLAAHGAGVAVAVYPVSLTTENAEAFRELKHAGVELTFWPLMEREQGYFPGERNIGEYRAMVSHLLDWAAGRHVLPDALAVDLEPPIQQMRTVTAADTRIARAMEIYSAARENLDLERYRTAKSALEDLNREVRGIGIRTISAVMPWVALELEGEHELLQDMSETPVGGIDFDVVSPMLYVTMLTAGGLLNRRDANWLVYESCAGLRARLGERAGVSLGLTGAGVLEDEPTFRMPEELLVGVQAALAAGVRDITVYSLEGVLARRNPAAWFTALRSADPKVPERSGKVSRGLAAARYAYPPLARLVDWYRRG